MRCGGTALLRLLPTTVVRMSTGPVSCVVREENVGCVASGPVSASPADVQTESGGIVHCIVIRSPSDGSCGLVFIGFGWSYGW